MANDTSKSWFAVFNNPAQHGYEGLPLEVCNRLRSEWDISDDRSGAWAYCIKHYVGHFPVYDEDGNFLRYQFAVTEEEKAKVPEDLHHIHMVLEDIKTMRFSLVKNTYAIGMHFEGTKGNKKEAEDYIAKTGVYSEKDKKESGLPWEEVIYVCRLREIAGRQGQRSDVQTINALINDGRTPREILSGNFSFYRYESMIRSAFFDKRDRETPPKRDVKVYWLVGAAGSGKSYYRMKLIEKYGEDQIYYLSTYGNGMFDKYNGEPILWIEDFKGEIKHGDLLRYLDIYKCDLPARFKNGKALWTEVYITSVMMPQAVYYKMVQDEKERKRDPIAQLMRRLTSFLYCWKDDNGYHTREFPKTYTLEKMDRLARSGDPDEPARYIAPEIYNKQFEEVDDDDALPF